MTPHRFVQARRPRVAMDVPKGKSARSGVFPADENTSATTTASYCDLTTEAEFATNSIAVCAYSISSRRRIGFKVSAMNEKKWTAAA